MLEAFTEFSHATMRAPDIARGILDHARPYLSAATIADLESCVQADDCADGIESVESALDELQEHTAPFCYVGSHEGDGAAIGVWPDPSALEYDEDVLRISDGSEIPATHGGLAAIVNDHGNVTLVSCHGPDESGDYCQTIEIWSVV